MVSSKATTVTEYLDALPTEQRGAIEAVRKTILKNLPKGYEESMQFGMIGYTIPLTRYPETYNGAPLMYAALAVQKNYMSVYLMGCYADSKTLKALEAAYKKAGKKLDMGKSCVRFKRLDDVLLPEVGKAIAAMQVDDFIALYENSRGASPKR